MEVKSESKYERLRKIGIGSYGVVFKCVNRQTDQIVAIKRYSENDTDPVIRKIAMREVRMLRQLKHPNLINLIEVFRRKRRLHLVFDYCELTVLDVIEKYGNNCPLNLIKKISWQIVNGINYCHDRNCIHRDIKPENILIKQSGIVKLCDFGFARNATKPSNNLSLQVSNAKLNQRDSQTLDRIKGQKVEEREINNNDESYNANERQAFTDYVATRWYRAPELLIGEIYYDTKIDIWAIGCVTAEMMRGEPIWPGKTDLDQLLIIKNSLGQLTLAQSSTLATQGAYDQANTERLLGRTSVNDPLDRKLPSRIGQSGMDFVVSCLQMDPNKRPRSSELLGHSFIHSSRMAQLSVLNTNSSANPNNRLASSPSSRSNIPLSRQSIVANNYRSNSQSLMLAANSPSYLPQPLKRGVYDNQMNKKSYPIPLTPLNTPSKLPTNPNTTGVHKRKQLTISHVDDAANVETTRQQQRLSANHKSLVPVVSPKSRHKANTNLKESALESPVSKGNVNKGLSSTRANQESLTVLGANRGRQQVKYGVDSVKVPDGKTNSKSSKSIVTDETKLDRKTMERKTGNNMATVSSSSSSYSGSNTSNTKSSSASFLPPIISESPK